jgi:thymidylate kinase
MNTLLYDFVEQTLDCSGLGHLCTTSRSDMLGAQRDIDWLVKSPRAAYRVLKAALVQSEFDIINVIYHGSGIRVNLLDGDGRIFPGPDFIWKAGNDSPILSRLLVKYLSREKGPIDVRLRDQILLYVQLTRFLDKSCCDSQRAARLLARIEGNPDKNRQLVVDGFGGKFLDVLLLVLKPIEGAVAANEMWFQKLKELRKSNYFLRFRTVNWLVYSRSMRIFLPARASIVFLGPDGVGKSSVINEFSSVLEVLCLKPKYIHLRPNIFWRRSRPISTDSNPHIAKPYGKLLSVLKLLVLAPDYLFLYCYDYYHRLRNNCLVFDRYYYDILVDPLRFRYGGPKWILDVLVKLFWRPSLVVVLKATPTNIYNRKAELSIDEIARQLTEYEKLVSLNGLNVTIVSADGNIDSTVTVVKKVFIEAIRPKTE